MSIVVNWKHVLLGARAAVAGVPTTRIARQQLLLQDQEPGVSIQRGTYPAVGHAPDTWNPLRPEDGQAPSSYRYPVDSPAPLTFVFAFWSYGSQDGGLAGTTCDRSPDLSIVGQTTTLTATAWYVRSWPGGGGDNRVFVDAYLQRAGGAEILWLPDNFVTVTPDTFDHALTAEANSGSISTSFPETGAAVETIHAAPSLPRTAAHPLVYRAPDILDPGAIDHLPLTFHRWRSAALGGDTLDRLTDHDGTDLEVDRGDNLYAFAVYHESWSFDLARAISDVIAVMTGTDGSIVIARRSDLAKGRFVLHPIPHPEWTPALLEQRGLGRRTIPWSSSTVVTAEQLQQLQRMAGDAAHSHDDLADVLAIIARGESR